MTSLERPAAICPCTGLTIPECSCKRCLEEQIRSFSPLLRKGRLQAVPPPPSAEARPEDGRAAA